MSHQQGEVLPGCLNDEAVQRFIIGAVSAEDDQALRVHYESCETCKQRIDARMGETGASSPTGAARPRELPEHEGKLARGTSLGRYVILELIGVGGMGEVYAAYDPQLDRKVALKLLRTQHYAGVDESMGRSRLLREAQAVARLAHPNVVAVHDVGTVDDQVFVALEFVAGETLRTWLLTGDRTWREVVPLFLQAGRGLAAAHAAGLVHRDFKPDNALIGSDGRVRVLDFGLARAEGPSAAETPEAAPPADHEGDSLLSAYLTAAGTVMGTPAYMAPEQLLGQTVDARTDQFNFCASLYDALYGCPPFDAPTLHQRTEQILAQKLTAPRYGQNTPSWLRAAVLKGLAPKADDRFASMQDLLNALSVDPARSRRKLAIKLAPVAVFLVLGGAYAWTHGRAERLCQQRVNERIETAWNLDTQKNIQAAFLGTKKAFAGAAWKGVEQRINTYVDRWVAREKSLCAGSPAGEEQASENVWLEKICLERRLGELRSLTELFSHPDAEVAENAVAAVESLGSISACRRRGALSIPEKPPADKGLKTRIAAAEKTLSQAKALFDAGKYAAAQQKAEALTGETKAVAYRPLLAENLVLLASAYDKGGNFTQAEQSVGDALAASDLGGDDETTARGWSLLGWIVGVRESRHVEGHRAMRHAEAALRRLGERPELEGELLHREGSIYLAEGNFEQARQFYEKALNLRREVLGSEHRDVAQSETNLAIAFARLGQLDSALVHYQRALQILSRALGPEHPDVAGVLTNLGVAYARAGRDTDAIAQYEHARRILEGTLGADHPQLADALTTLGAAYARIGRNEDALRCAERSLAIREKTSGPSSLQFADALVALATAHASMNQLGEAVTIYRRSLAIAEGRLAPEHPDVLNRKAKLGGLLLRAKDGPGAISLLKTAASSVERSKGVPTNVAVAVYQNLGAALAAQGRLKEGLDSVERARSLLPPAKTASEQAHHDRLAAQARQIQQMMKP